MEVQKLKIKTETINIELIPAIADDLKEFVCWVNLGEGKQKKKMKMKTGFPFWLKSMVTGKIEPTPRIMHEHRSAKEIAEWLKFKIIYIAKDPFNER